MIKPSTQRFTVSVPVKPYVKRFIEMNFGLPADFTNNPPVLKFFHELLQNPSHYYDKNISDEIYYQSATVAILISEHDFYRYGWQLTKTDTVAFGKYFQNRAKLLMRNVIGCHVGLGMPLNKSILKFQNQFQFHEDIWAYQSIRKDFYRNCKTEVIDFNFDIYNKIQNIILRNLYNLGTFSNLAIQEFEKNK